MKKLKSEHASTKQRKANILQAALSCFTELGFQDTSMADICTRAGASTGSVYHHFRSKEQLAAAVYLEGIELYQSGLLNMLEKETDAFKGISSVITYHLSWVQDNPDWSRFLFQKRHAAFLMDKEDDLLVLNKTFMKGIADWFKPHMTAGIIRPLAWDIVIAILLGPCEEYTSLYLSKNTATNPDQAIRDLSLSAWCSLANND